jgi:flagellum-specific ATP synthase
MLKSISRSMPDCNTPDETKMINRARGMLAAYENMAELIRLGAYKKGTDAAVDEAIDHYPLIEDFLTQATYEQSSFDEGYERLAEIVTPKRREADKTDPLQKSLGR